MASLTTSQMFFLHSGLSRKRPKGFQGSQPLSMKKYQVFFLQSLRRAASTHMHTPVWQPWRVYFQYCIELKAFLGTCQIFLFNTRRKKWCWITRNDEQKNDWHDSTLQRVAFLPCEWIYPGSTSNRGAWETRCFFWAKRGRQISTCHDNNDVIGEFTRKTLLPQVLSLTIGITLLFKKNRCPDSKAGPDVFPYRHWGWPTNQ